MPTTNPYGYDAPVADINKGTNPSPDSSYVTQRPVTTSGFPAAQPSQSPASFGGAGSALAATTDFNYPGQAGYSGPSKPPVATAPVPTSWTPPPTGTITQSGPTGYNSPTPPPGWPAPPGASWITDGQGHYGWGTSAATGTQQSPTAVTAPVAGQAPVVSGTGGMTYGAPTIGPASAQPTYPQGAPTSFTPVPATTGATGTQSPVSAVTNPVAGQTPVVSGTGGMTFGAPNMGSGSQGPISPVTNPVAGQTPIVSGAGGLTYAPPSFGATQGPAMPVTAPIVNYPGQTGYYDPSQSPSSAIAPVPPSGYQIQPWSQTVNPIPPITPQVASSPAPGQSTMTTPAQWQNPLPQPTQPPAQPTTGALPVLPTPGQWQNPLPPTQPTQSGEQPGQPFTGYQPVLPTATQWMNPIPEPSQGAPPWAQALQGGWNLPAFINPDQGAGTVPTTQQWANFTPTEKSAVASLNWSTTGMTVDDLNNYMARSSPQWNTPQPVSYRSY